MIEFIPVIMTCDHLADQIPVMPFPSNYYCSLYESGDELVWCRLQTMTDSFEKESEAYQYFQEEFGDSQEELKKRCFFLKTDQHKCIGSAMAWYGDGSFDVSYGRLHWVVIDPDFQGRGLGKKLISFILQQLSRQYNKIYLTTQTTSYPAINIYLDLGFKPYISNEVDTRAWTLLKDLLQHPALL